MQYRHQVFVLKTDMTPLDFVDPETGLSEINKSSLADYEQRYGAGNVIIMDSETLRQARRAASITKPVEITADQFEEMLNILPPKNWRQGGGWESFMMVEHQTDDITGIYVHVRQGAGSRYFAFYDSCKIHVPEIQEKVLAAFPDLKG